MKQSTFGLVILLFLVVAGAAGCGYKTMPVPPEDIVPRAITDLRYELGEAAVKLNWTYPAETVKGDSLEDSLTFSLYRAVVPAGDYCETCPVPFGEPIQVDGGSVSKGALRTGEYEATLLRPGSLYFFKIRSGAGWWAQSADSNVVSFLWDVPPSSPQGLAAEVADGKVMLRWKGVTTNRDGGSLAEQVKYQVLRSSGGPFVQAGDLLEETVYTDSQVVNGRKYSYKIQAVTLYEKGTVGGAPSEAVSATPVDQTPPAVPTGIKGIRTSSGVKIIWENVSGTDVRGYRIYRRLPGQSKPERIGEVLEPTTIFNDTAVPAAEEWFYSVSSFDHAGPANESGPSEEVRVRN